jgi:ATP-dependent Clp protease ATP-binding subunit ClpA
LPEQALATRSTYSEGRGRGRHDGLMFERLSVPARQVIVRARDESERLNDHLALDSGHLLVAMAGREGDQAQRALAAVGLAPATIRSALEEARTGRGPGRLGHFGADMTEVVAAAIARRATDDVTTADLLLAIIDTPNCVGRNLLLEAGADIEAVRSAAIDALAEDDPTWTADRPGVWAITVGSDDPDGAWGRDEA